MTCEHGYPNIIANDLLAACSCTAKKSERRPALECVHIACDGETLTIESTDCFKLVHIERHTTAQGEFDVLINGAALKSAVKKNGLLSIENVSEKSIEGWFMPKRGRSSKVYLETSVYEYPNTAPLLARKTAANGSISLPTINPEYTAQVLKAAALVFPDTGAMIIPQGSNEPVYITATSRHDERSSFVGLVMPIRGGARKTVNVANEDSKDVEELKKRIAALECENAHLRDAWDATCADYHEMQEKNVQLSNDIAELCENMREKQAQPVATWDSAFTRPSALYEATQLVTA